MMLVVGLTGSIGMGKSTVARRFIARGIGVCDADAEVHKLYMAGGAAVAAIEREFPGVTGSDGVDRPKLAAVLMRDPSGFKRLEAIVHPLVYEAEREFLRAEARRGASMAVLEIPLLFEGSGASRVDVIVVVSAPPEKQRQRVLERPGMTPEKLDQILKRQMPDSEKRNRADFVIDTGVSIADTEAEVDQVIETLRNRVGTAFERFWA